MFSNQYRSTNMSFQVFFERGRRGGVGSWGEERSRSCVRRMNGKLTSTLWLRSQFLVLSQHPVCCILETLTDWSNVSDRIIRCRRVTHNPKVFYICFGNIMWVFHLCMCFRFCSRVLLMSLHMFSGLTFLSTYWTFCRLGPQATVYSLRVGFTEGFWLLCVLGPSLMGLAGRLL